VDLLLQLLLLVLALQQICLFTASNKQSSPQMLAAVTDVDGCATSIRQL
jgi:hypothetical protein